MEGKKKPWLKWALLSLVFLGLGALLVVIVIARSMSGFGEPTSISIQTAESIIGTKLPESAKGFVGVHEGFQDNLYRARWEMDESEIESLVSKTEGKELKAPEYAWNHSDNDPNWWRPGQGECLGTCHWKEGPPDFYVQLYFVRDGDQCSVYLHAYDT